MKHEILIIRKTNKTVKTKTHEIWAEEFAKVSMYLDKCGKSWDDINLKTFYYISRSRIPYKCGGKFRMLRGRNDDPGYIVCFQFHGEHIPKKEPKPNRKYGKKV